MPKIALAIIVKGDEGELLDRCLSSVHTFVDGIFITVTTKDVNISKLKDKYPINIINAENKFTVKITQEIINWLKENDFYTQTTINDEIFQFDVARNYSFDQVPQDYEYIMWLDADDVVRGAENIQEAVKLMSENKYDSLFFNYLYQVEIDENQNIKNVLVEHVRERIVKRNKFKWISTIHETLISKQPVIQVESKLFDVIHLTNTEKLKSNLNRNINALEYSIYKTEGKDPRQIYYLGKSYFDEAAVNKKTEFFDIAINLFKRYLTGKYPSNWLEERSQCWNYIAESERNMKRFDKSIQASFNSLQEFPFATDSYLTLALTYTFLKDWHRAWHWLTLAHSFEQPPTTMVVNPKEEQLKSQEIAYFAAINLGKLDIAENAIKILLQIDPENQEFQKRMKHLQTLKSQDELIRNAITMAGYLKMTDKDKLYTYIASLPNEIKGNQHFVNLVRENKEPRKHLENEITIFCGFGFTNWSPSLMENPQNTFVGGSEEAVIYMARELAELGWKVTVYGDPITPEMDRNVNYLPAYELNLQDEFNIFISWRQVAIVDSNIKSKQIYIWNHDVINQTEYTKERLDKISKIFVLSEAHKKNIPNVPENKIFVTSNGVFYEK